MIPPAASPSDGTLILVKQKAKIHSRNAPRSKNKCWIDKRNPTTCA